MAVLFSYELDNDRSTRALFGMEISQLLEDERLAWVHLDLTAADVHEWLKTNVSYLGESLISALLADETRPRISNHGNGMLLILRGVNSNENSDPEDMVSTRLWIDEHRIISIQKRNLSAIDDVVKDIQQGHGPGNICGRGFRKECADGLRSDDGGLQAAAGRECKEYCGEGVCERPNWRRFGGEHI